MVEITDGGNVTIFIQCLSFCCLTYITVQLISHYLPRVLGEVDREPANRRYASYRPQEPAEGKFPSNCIILEAATVSGRTQRPLHTFTH